MKDMCLLIHVLFMTYLNVFHLHSGDVYAYPVGHGILLILIVLI